MSRKSRQVALLALLLVALAWIVLRPIGGGIGQTGVVRSARAGVGPGERDSDVVDVRLEDLIREPGVFRPGRDPFQYRTVPTPPPQRQPTARTPPPRPQRPVVGTAAPARPRPPAIDFIYLGSFGPSRRKIAVFTDNAEIYNVLEGGVVKKEFVVEAIGLESADIGFVNFPDEPAKKLAAGG